MQEYYQQYYQIVPLKIRQIISADQQMQVVNELAERYGLNVPMLVMRLMIREIGLDQLQAVLVDEFGLDQDRARELEGELQEKILAPVMDYLQGDGVAMAEIGWDESRADENMSGAFDQPLDIIEPQEPAIRIPASPAGGQTDFKSQETNSNPDTEQSAALGVGFDDDDDGSVEIHDFEPLREKTENGSIDTIETGGSLSDELRGIFTKFIQSSIYINAQEFANGLMDKQLIEIKEGLYKAVNAGEAFKAMGSLMIIARRGVIRYIFEKDNRYIEFWKKQLTNIRGDEDKGLIEEFYKDPAREKYLVSFFRFILEKRCGLSEGDSAIVGVVLGALSREAGELEYQDLAYGDEDRMVFGWVK